MSDRLFEVDPPPRPWIVAAYAKYQTVSPPAVAAAGDSVVDTLQKQFEEFDRDNPHVYDTLVELALDLRDKGQPVSIGMLFEIIRWQVAMGTYDKASPFKLNNNFRSRYARKIMESVPELADAFDVRELRAA